MLGQTLAWPSGSGESQSYGPMLPGYLLSLLTKQRALLRERFDARYPHAWLVWEPGTRLRPESPAELEAGRTKLPARDTASHPVGNDAVCFPLPTPTKEGNCLTIGRQSEASITVDDMSISREHALLFCKSGVWQIQPASIADTLVAGVPLHQGQRAPLANGCVIKIGGVTLTFYERHRFVERLETEKP